MSTGCLKPVRWVGDLPRARGLGVMMPPSHGEDREFDSLRAHHLVLEAKLNQPWTVQIYVFLS